MFEHGILNLTNWLGNVIMPTLAGLFFAAAIYHFGKKQPYSHLSWAGFAALMCSGLLRALEGFAAQAGANDPDRLWIAILTLVNWVGNVMLPLYGAMQVVLAVVHSAGVLERLTVGEPWVRNVLTAMMCFGLSGLLRLAESFIAHGTAGVR
jgi:hypothetical protein